MTNTLTAEQTRIADLESALRQARAAIMKAAEDTLWCEDSPAETVVDRIDAVLGGEDETGDLFPSPPSPPVSGGVALYQLELENGEIEHLSGYFGSVSEIDGIRVVKSTPLYASPLPNEPVGVTISLEDAALLKAFMEKPVPNTETAIPLREAYARLSAAIGERG